MYLLLLQQHAVGGLQIYQRIRICPRQFDPINSRLYNVVLHLRIIGIRIVEWDSRDNSQPLCFETFDFT